MSSIENDVQLLAAVKNGNTKRVAAALGAGADVNGHPERPYVPIAAAVMTGNAFMVEFLLERGADPDRPITKKMPNNFVGERALHIAVRFGKVDIVRLLLNRSGADPNATDHVGGTPLMMACSRTPVCVEVVRLLLGAGADPALADDGGFTALHLAARHDRIDVVDMLCTRAPTTLMTTNTGNDCSPLAMACVHGHESMASPG